MSAPVAGRPTTDRLLAHARGALPRFLTELSHLVGVDSGSYNADGVNRVGDWLESRMRCLDFAVERLPGGTLTSGRRAGDILVARRAGSLPQIDGGRRILLAGHMDTVFDDGTAADRPFSVRGSRAYGPGVSDDKGGLLAGVHAIEALDAAGCDRYAELIFMATPDEEIGSPTSREVTEAAAASADCALALECARENGDLVIARKGVTDLRIAITGRAAHAGIEPERGAHAALAAAHLVVALQGLNGKLPDISVNVGVLQAGSRPNIVPAEADLHVEIRSTSTKALRACHQAVAEMAAVPAVAGTRAAVTVTDMCPPMEDSPAARRLADAALRLGAELGLRLGAAATGGVGDANIIAGTGTPVLDGLGPVGGGDHSCDEWLEISSAPERVALLAALIAELGDTRALSRR
ncbi:M20/M25/M40 family metallo-hydrolase [Streptomyces sp. NPDC059819]|uniref:M20/M25/M40 family metallo-hydrolase n=1 Tax=Streptomyces sp. NPDC059819 TaxID=3346963 RepID=UPI00365B951A